jgi:Protein of unknown function (DUF3224)
MPLIARFDVEGFDQTAVDRLDADWVDVLVFTKTFTAGITGSATTLFLSSGPEGNRSYVATERISGRLAGESDSGGSITVQHGGLESDPATWFGHIVPGTGTGSFAGWSGAARIQHDDDGAYFEFD